MKQKELKNWSESMNVSILESLITNPKKIKNLMAVLDRFRMKIKMRKQRYILKWSVK